MSDLFGAIKNGHFYAAPWLKAGCSQYAQQSEYTDR